MSCDLCFMTYHGQGLFFFFFFLLYLIIREKSVCIKLYYILSPFYINLFNIINMYMAFKNKNLYGLNIIGCIFYK